MKSAGRLKREHFSTQHVVKLCKSWPRDIMETKITNGFKSWWGNLAEDRATSFCSKLCPGWKPRSPYVTRSCERGEGHSVPALLLVCFAWAFPSDHTQGMDPREALLLGVTTVLFCYAFKISEVFIFIGALFRIFCHCLKWETQTYQCVCPSQLFKMSEKQPIPHLQRDCCPRKSLLGWERPWGTDSHLPPPHTPCGALEKGPCRPCHASASPASPPRTCRPWAASSSCE